LQNLYNHGQPCGYDELDSYSYSHDSAYRKSQLHVNNHSASSRDSAGSYPRDDEGKIE
jgi:hypothetical protein